MSPLLYLTANKKKPQVQTDVEDVKFALNMSCMTFCWYILGFFSPLKLFYGYGCFSCVSVCLYTMYILGGHGSQKWTLGPLKTGLQTAVSNCVGAKNWILSPEKWTLSSGRTPNALNLWAFFPAPCNTSYIIKLIFHNTVVSASHGSRALCVSVMWQPSNLQGCGLTPSGVRAQSTAPFLDTRTNAKVLN